MRVEFLHTKVIKIYELVFQKSLIVFPKKAHQLLVANSLRLDVSSSNSCSISRVVLGGIC